MGPALTSHLRPLRTPLVQIGRLLHRSALVFVALITATPTTAQEVTVQVTAFQVPELTIGLEAWSQSINDDAALYERLVRLAGLGEAQIVLDQRIVTRSRQRVKSEARSEYIWPTEFEPIEDRFLHMPSAFETTNLGVLIEAEAAKSDPEAIVPISWEMIQSGTSLRAEVISGDRSESGTINLEFHHHIANPTLRTVEEMQVALDSKRKVVPAPTIHLITVAGEFDFTHGHPQILAIDPSPAPLGHPEHGRWMVTVLKVSSGR
ncbi:MAG: hypothetical protein ACKV19_06760 [Verrucomicrobiales bacterium]